MDFSFTEELQQLEDTVRRFVAKDYTFERRRAILASAEGWSREAWQQIADLGLLALNVPEAHGGLGGGPVDTLVVMNALGPGLPLEPYLASAVAATALLRDCPAQAGLMEKMAAGERIAVIADAEPHGVATLCRAAGTDFLLDGRKCVVAHAATADLLIVSAHLGDDLALFLVPRDAPGLALDSYPTLDGTHASEVRLDGVRLPAAARLEADGDALERALHIGLAALCAEAVGIMKATLDTTVDYLRTRRQFGQPIGRLQALQHRAADMLMHYEQAKSMSYLAAMRCTAQDARERRRALAAAKVTVNRAARFIGQQAVQLHGGMGMTDELIVSHWFKRLTAIELACGDSDTHLQHFIEASAYV
ncbi:MAG: acyl-CoA dehydrogenase family protein [Rhodocyclaceae bacterium]|jgi:alkylation response protein AidB-like acyl-CoA dehydrogenase|nr:acyl-CoA dehydrogenase family protein [Rhodocyclaceae bacterium]MCL4681836.1 acyl-CoA dehydrogenase family protein [Rhodocyclaceae bacterium]